MNTSQTKIQKENNDISFVANCISTSFGGAVVGGASGNIQWAFAGGLFGVVVAVWSAVLQHKRKNQL